jgi:hypothetical protein
MLSLTRESRTDKARDALREVISYADEVVRDDRLRADIRAAVGHGANAGDRIKRAIDTGGITTRLAEDKKLRKELRALLDDLDNASGRLRRKRRHRARNVLLIVTSAGAALAVVPNVRHWLSSEGSEPASGSVRGAVNTFTPVVEPEAVHLT